MFWEFFRPAMYLLFFVKLTFSSLACAATINGNSQTYLSKLRLLRPGDTLALAAGTYYGGFPLHGVNGRAGQRIEISGPRKGAPAVFGRLSCA